MWILYNLLACQGNSCLKRFRSLLLGLLVVGMTPAMLLSTPFFALWPTLLNPRTRLYLRHRKLPTGMVIHTSICRNCCPQQEPLAISTNCRRLTALVSSLQTHSHTLHARTHTHTHTQTHTHTHQATRSHETGGEKRLPAVAACRSTIKTCTKNSQGERQRTGRKN